MTQLRHTDWPDRLWIVRHGQSAGKVARDIDATTVRHTASERNSQVLTAIGQLLMPTLRPAGPV